MPQRLLLLLLLWLLVMVTDDDDEDEEMAETADGDSMNVEESSQGSTTSDHLQHKSQSS